MFRLKIDRFFGVPGKCSILLIQNSYFYVNLSTGVLGRFVLKIGRFRKNMKILDIMVPKKHVNTIKIIIIGISISVLLNLFTKH